MGVYKKGNYWYIDYYLRGQRKRKKIGPSKKLAEQVLKDVQVKIAKREFLDIAEEKKILEKERGEIGTLRKIVDSRQDKLNAQISRFQNLFQT